MQGSGETSHASLVNGDLVVTQEIQRPRTGNLVLWQYYFFRGPQTRSAPHCTRYNKPIVRESLSQIADHLNKNTLLFCAEDCHWAGSLSYFSGKGLASVHMLFLNTL
ncbi:kallikrein-14-like [Platysternon megacephalum]|uniref:Kallikrein-14-like n=1 Tax=Platysternon megacephalum TaxID=55544 RepID=A0A4D9EHA1_9SAUR|nr:kallikrein-14-like [Platysternon megacephalum]